MKTTKRSSVQSTTHQDDVWRNRFSRFASGVAESLPVLARPSRRDSDSIPSRRESDSTGETGAMLSLDHRSDSVQSMGSTISTLTHDCSFSTLGSSTYGSIAGSWARHLSDQFTGNSKRLVLDSLYESTESLGLSNSEHKFLADHSDDKTIQAPIRRRSDYDDQVVMDKILHPPIRQQTPDSIIRRNRSCPDLDDQRMNQPVRKVSNSDLDEESISSRPEKSSQRPYFCRSLGTL